MTERNNSMKTKKKTNAKKTDKKKKIAKKSVTKKPAGKQKLLQKKTKKIAVKKAKPVTKKSTLKTASPKKKIVKTKVQKKQIIRQETKPVKKRLSPKGKLRYSPKELEYFKKILLQERNAILESAKANMKSLVDSESGEYVGDNSTYATHMAEQGTDEMEREKNYLFVQRDEKYLGYIQEALNRIDLGTYGVCIDCLEEPKLLCDTCPLIPKERLELVPITQHCLECKQLRG